MTTSSTRSHEPNYGHTRTRYPFASERMDDLLDLYDTQPRLPPLRHASDEMGDPGQRHNRRRRGLTQQASGLPLEREPVGPRRRRAGSWLSDEGRAAPPCPRRPLQIELRCTS